jgi:Lysyl oxidase
MAAAGAEGAGTEPMTRRLTAAAIVLLTAALAAVPAGGADGGARGYGGGYPGGYAGGGAAETTRGNPCLTPQRRRLLCPDLKIAKPSDLYIDTQVRPGKRLLRATNNLRSRGLGPVEIRGRRITELSMDVTQRIHRRGGGRLAIPTTGRLDFTPIPGQYRYWKYRDAAAFELWSTAGGRPSRVRVGPKQNYCLRDLERTRPGRRSPSRRVYPACSQDPNRRSVVLGTSVGWSDIYPATYHQNWINVTGLRGCFAFVHIADPKNHIRELDEGNNRATIHIRLPSLRVVSRCPSAAPGPGGPGTGGVG